MAGGTTGTRARGTSKSNGILRSGMENGINHQPEQQRKHQAPRDQARLTARMECTTDARRLGTSANRMLLLRADQPFPNLTDRRLAPRRHPGHRNGQNGTTSRMTHGSSVAKKARSKSIQTICLTSTSLHQRSQADRDVSTIPREDTPSKTALESVPRRTCP